MLFQSILSPQSPHILFFVFAGSHKGLTRVSWSQFSGMAIASYRNQLEVALLKNLSFLALFKLDAQDFFEYNKEIESMGKTLPSTCFIDINIT